MVASTGGMLTSTGAATLYVSVVDGCVEVKIPPVDAPVDATINASVSQPKSKQLINDITFVSSGLKIQILNTRGERG